MWKGASGMRKTPASFYKGICRQNGGFLSRPFWFVAFFNFSSFAIIVAKSHEQAETPVFPSSLFEPLQNLPSNSTQEAKMFLLKVVLAKASNELPEAEISNQSADPRMRRIEEVGRFYRGSATLGTDFLNRYFLFRYDQGNRWTWARDNPSKISARQNLTISSSTTKHPPPSLTIFTSRNITLILQHATRMPQSSSENVTDFAPSSTLSPSARSTSG